MRASKQTSFEKVRGVNEVRVDADVAHVVVDLPPEKATPDKHLDIYKELGAAGMPLRLIKMHPGGVSFAVERQDLPRAGDTLRSLGYTFEAHDNLVILSIMAVNMREMFGVMAKMAETLLDNNIDIYQVGDAHDAVLCLVPKQEAQTALKTLREVFDLAEPNRPAALSSQPSL